MYYTIVDYMEKEHHLEFPNYEDFALEATLGGKVQWCWSKRFHEWSLRLLYYKVRAIRQLEAQVSQPRILFHNSGFVSHQRGLHWNRKCRLERK